MRILLDSCVWGKAHRVLEAEGHDAVWSGNWPNDPGDAEILTRAHEDRRVLLTLDKDFGELAVLRGMSHCGILRLVNISAHQQAVVCMQVLAEHGADLESGAIITAEPGRLRVRLP